MRLVYSQFNSEVPETDVENPTYDPKEKIKNEIINKIEADDLIKYTYCNEDDGTSIIKGEIKFYRIYENIELEDSSTNDVADNKQA